MVLIPDNSWDASFFLRETSDAVGLRGPFAVGCQMLKEAQS